MRKSYAVPFLIMCIGAITSVLLKQKDEKRDEAIRSHPMMYAYFIDNGGVINRVLMTDDRECLEDIKAYYDLPVPSNPMPNCQYQVIELFSEVFIIEDIDSTAVEVAWYRERQGITYFYSGLVCKEHLTKDIPDRIRRKYRDKL
ncbi:hypothetical protein [Reichenbachiella ulvae]|uniref:Uncharacterized protein n=1 Tax=Reichenbachiella ulvae TaxID=2980104 RepID=A0ABT3CSD1_9BACT|nr:hypothetical protein [Reichenbachiella ulvae]MCV9386616.1 hypothetical protein [Reichenbachiella ulvae]